MELKIVGGEKQEAHINESAEEYLMHRQSFKIKREKNIEMEKQRVQKQEELQQQEQ